MADDDQRLLAEAKKLQMSERIAHASWKVRSAAYEDIATACSQIYDDADPRLSEYAPLFSKAAAESNPSALNKALEALHAFLGKAPEALASRICDKTCTCIVSKCLGGRQDACDKSYEAMKLFIELEQGEKVMECLLAGFSNKVPKVVVASLEGVYQCINAFGIKVVLPQPVIKALPGMFEVKDNKARDKVKEIVVELVRWMGADTVKALLFGKMRDAMKAEIEVAMQEVVGSRPQPVRLTRKLQAKRAAAGPEVQLDAADPAASAPAAGNGAAAMEVDEDPAADPYDFSEPKAILNDLKKEYSDGIISAKWSERKAALQQLRELASTPRIAPGDYGDVNRELRKLITKDSNVVVVAEAIGCCGALAQGLRKDYAATARGLASVLLEKLKEKNAAVGKAVIEALSAMHRHCWSLQDVQEDLVAALGHANPKVKEEALNWLTQEVAVEPKAHFKALIPTLLAAAAKCAEEAAPTLREAAMAFMAAFAVKFGNPVVLEKLSAGLDDARKKKLQDMVAEASGAPKPSASPGPKRSLSALPPVANAPSPPAKDASRPRFGLGATKAPARPASKPGGVPAANGGASTSAGASKKALPGAGADDEASLSSGTLSKDQAQDALTALMGADVTTRLQDEQWKTRLDAMDEVLAKVADPEVVSTSGSTLVQVMSYIPGWAEKNFQVMTKQFEVIRIVAESASSLSKRDAFVSLGGLIEKVGDVKLKSPSFATLSSLAEAVGPQFMMSQLHKKAAAHKNPKVLSEAINWMATAIKDFGLAGMDVKALLGWMKEDLGSANAGVRNSAVQLLGVMHGFLGAPLGDLIVSDVKPALMTAIYEEFKKNPQGQGFQPSRTSRVAPAAAAAGKATPGAKAGKSGGAAAAAAPAAFDPDDLLPRSDISGSITEEFVRQLGSANWKERKAALDELESILTQAGNRILPQTGELFPELKKRLGDSNKNLVIQAVALLGKLAKAMGRSIERGGRTLLPPAIRNISDQKPMVRAAVTDMLDAWVTVAPVEGAVTEVMEVFTSSKVTTDGKAESLTWLGSLAAGGKLGDSAPEALRGGVLGSQDKAIEVRDAANKLLSALIATYDTDLGPMVAGLDSSIRKAAQEAITKLTGAPLSVPVLQASAAGPSRPATGVRTSTNGLRSSTSSLSKAPAAPAAKASAVRSSTILNRGVGGLAAAADPGGLIIPDNKKEERAKKGRFRPNKLQIAADEAQSLEAEFAPLLGPGLKAAVFSKDFKKHCEAADMLTRALPTIYDDAIAVIDLIFRWCTLRILESNTASLVKVLELLKAVLDAMADHGYRMSEFEAKLILPAVVEKAGHNQDKVKAEHKELFRRAALVQPPARVISFIRDGLESKNSKTKVVCLEEIGAMVERHGPVVYRSAPASSSGAASRPSSGAGGANEPLLGAVAKLVLERDTAVRAACLGVVENVLSIEGDGIWRQLGKLPDAQKSLIEERIKTATNKLARQGLAPGYRAAEFGVEDAEAATGGGTTPRQQPASPMRPPSPSLRRSGIGLGGGATAAATKPAGSSNSVLDVVRPSTSGPPAAAASSRPATAGVARQDAYPSAAEARGLASPMSRYGNGVAPSAAGQAAVDRRLNLENLQGIDDEETMCNWVAITHRIQSGDWEAAIQAMKMLCYSYMEEVGKRSHLAQQGLPPPGGLLYNLLTDPRHVEEVLVLLGNRMEESFSIAGNSTQNVPGAPECNMRACKYSVNTAMNIINLTQLSGNLGDAALRSLFSALVSCIIDERLRLVPDGEGLLKAVNMIIMKLLENAPKPGVFGALINLLREPNPRIYTMAPMSAETVLIKWNEMTVKCLIKMTKMLQTCIQTLDVPAVVLHIHQYMQELGAEEVRRRSTLEDKPLRMIKTLLHELCKLRGQRIFDDARQVSDVVASWHDCVMMPYIHLNLETAAEAANRGQGLAPMAPPTPTGASATGTAGPAPTAAPLPMQRSTAAGFSASDSSAEQPHVLAPISTNAQTLPPSMGAAQGSSPKPERPTIQVPVAPTAMPGSSGPSGLPSSGPASSSAPIIVAGPVIDLNPSSAEFTRRVTDEQVARNVLAAIFKRIGDKSQSSQALVDLHHFLEANPNMDVLNQMIQTVSPFFKNYLQRGLNKVKTQIALAVSTGMLPPGLSSPAPAARTSPGEVNSSWGSPDGEATVAANAPTTMADKLAAVEGAPSPSSPSRLRLGNLEALKSRMSNLETNLEQIPVRNSVNASLGPNSAQLQELQERMKRLNSITAAPPQ